MPWSSNVRAALIPAGATGDGFLDEALRAYERLRRQRAQVPGRHHIAPDLHLQRALHAVQRHVQRQAGTPAACRHALETGLCTQAARHMQRSPDLVLPQLCLDWPLARLAEHCQLGVRQFERQFLRAYGQSLRQFRQQWRCSQLLASQVFGMSSASKPRPWADIALDGAYFDQAHFSRDMRRFTGYSPAQLARLLAEQDLAASELAFHGPYDAAGQALAPPVVMGITHPYRARPLGAERMVYRFHLAQPGDYVIYLRAVSRLGQVYALTAWDTGEYMAGVQTKRLFDGLSYGILLGMLAYNLVLLVLFRDRVYAYYLLNCASALLTIASFNGHVARYLWPDQPGWAEWVYVLAPATWIVGAILFARRFLDLARYARFLAD